MNIAEARTTLGAFVGALNRGMPHALDRKRFYDFIIAANRGEPLVTQQVTFLLEELGMTAQEAREWARQYDDGIALLRRYSEVTPGGRPAAREPKER
jgi:hypothetical protein